MNRNFIMLGICILLGAIIVSVTIIFWSIKYQIPKRDITAIQANNNKSMETNSSISMETINKKDHVKFEVSKFELNYHEDIAEKDFLYNETYNGTGFIIATGDAEMIKKPYYVSLQIKKVKGGQSNPNNSDNTITGLILVTNGSGTFTTTDHNWKKDNKMIKPEYEFKIIGYIPITEQN